jgi:hypothetical protein
VTITGTNFIGVSAVSFGTIPAASYTVNSPTSITAVVGNGASGSVAVTATGGTASLAGFTFTFPTGIIDPRNNSPELLISPNPSDDLVKIRHPSSSRESRIRFFDLMGKEVKQVVPAVNTKETWVSVRMLPTGIYRISWSDGKRILTRNFMVQ